MSDSLPANGPRIKELRERKGLTQEGLAEELAKEAGPSKRSVENAEAGYSMKRSTLAAIAKALDVSLDEVVTPVAASLPTLGDARLAKVMETSWKGSGWSFVIGDLNPMGSLEVCVTFTGSRREKTEGGQRIMVRGEMLLRGTTAERYVALVGEYVEQHFSFQGEMRDQHLLQLEYVNDKGEFQFGHVVMYFLDDGNRCECTFAGWGSRTKKVVHGEVDLTPG